MKRRIWVQTLRHHHSRVTTDKLFFKKVSSLKLPTTFSASILKETVSTVSWNDQDFVEESRDLISGVENTSKSTQRLQAPMHRPSNLCHPPNCKIETLLITMSCEMVTIMCYHCLVILDILRLIPKYSLYLLSILHTLLKKCPLRE